MEHLIFVLIQFILWLDRQSLKPLERAVSDLPHLLEDPVARLAQGDVTIGPMRRWASAAGLGLVVLLVVVGVAFLLLLVLQDANLGRPVRGGAMLGAVIVLLAIGVPCLIALLRVLRGGRLVLRTEGVEVHYRGRLVRCPWALFRADGKPYSPQRDRMLLPVNPAAVPFVEECRHEQAVAQGMAVQLSTFNFKTGSLASLKGVYEVEVPELGELLLKLGRRLGEKLPARSSGDEAPADDEAPLTRGQDGWIKARLTHLTFPPFCCVCEGRTRERRELLGYAICWDVGGVPLVQAGDFAKLEVPLCSACQQEEEQVRGSAAGKGASLGLGLAFLVAAALALAAGRRVLLLSVFPLGLVGLLVGGVIGYQVGRRRASPLALRDYSPTEGTLWLRFRNPTYNDALMELLHGREGPQPEGQKEPEGALSER